MSTEPSNRCCPTDLGVAPCAHTPEGDTYYMVGPITATAGIVIAGDIFGLLDNSKRFADMLGAAGYLAVMPDFLGADAWDHHDWPPNFDGDKWKNYAAMITDSERYRPRARRAIAMLRKIGCEKVAIVGMCWGAGVAFDVAGEGLTDAVATAHPSFFSEKYINAVTNIPVCVLPSCNEPPMKDVEDAVKRHPKYHVYKRYEHLVHGFFAARYEYNTCTDEQKTELEDAQNVILDFLGKSLH